MPEPSGPLDVVGITSDDDTREQMAAGYPPSLQMVYQGKRLVATGNGGTKYLVASYHQKGDDERLVQEVAARVKLACDPPEEQKPEGMKSTTAEDVRFFCRRSRGGASIGKAKTFTSLQGQRLYVLKRVQDSEKLQAECKWIRPEHRRAILQEFQKELKRLANDFVEQEVASAHRMSLFLSQIVLACFLSIFNSESASAATKEERRKARPNAANRIRSILVTESFPDVAFQEHRNVDDVVEDLLETQPGEGVFSPDDASANSTNQHGPEAINPLEFKRLLNVFDAKREGLYGRSMGSGTTTISDTNADTGDVDVGNTPVAKMRGISAKQRQLRKAFDAARREAEEQRQELVTLADEQLDLLIDHPDADQFNTFMENYGGLALPSELTIKFREAVKKLTDDDHHLEVEIDDGWKPCRMALSKPRPNDEPRIALLKPGRPSSKLFTPTYEIPTNLRVAP